MRFIWGAATHQGVVRKNNEDSLFPDSSGEAAEAVVLMVADGMGGHVAGEVASRLAVNAAASTPIILPPIRLTHNKYYLSISVGRRRRGPLLLQKGPNPRVVLNGY